MVRDVLERFGDGVGAQRASFIVMRPLPSSIIWGSPPLGEPLEIPLDAEDRDAGILQVWAEATFVDVERDAAASLAAVLAALLGPVSPEGTDADRWVRRHLDSVPVVTYLEYPDEDHSFGFAEIFVSAQIEPMLGYTPKEWIEEDTDEWLDSIHPEDRASYEKEIERAASTDTSYQVEYRIRHKVTGEWIWVRDVARSIRVEGESRPYWHGAMIDITVRKELEEQIAYLAYHDSLTGLANRKRFEEELDLAIVRAVRNDTSVAVLFLDLNNFKQVNDTLGHDVGDRLLEQVAGRLRDATRATDLIARQGGDEFLVLVADIEPRPDTGPFSTGPSRAHLVVGELADRIDDALASTFAVEDRVITTGAAIGASIFREDADDARSLMKNADGAMYAVKRSRRGRGYLIGTEVAQEDAG